MSIKKSIFANKNFLKVTSINYFLVGLKIIVGFLLIPFLLQTLGKERFGVWQTLLSIATMASVLNFGLGNGLRNFISKSLVLKTNNLGSFIGTVFLKLSKILFFIFLIGVPLLFIYINPEFLFLNLSINTVEIKISIIIFLSFFLLNTLFSLSDSIAFGFHKSYIPNAIQLLYFAISLFLCYFLSTYQELNLINTSIIFGGTLFVLYLVSILYLNKKFKLKINFFEKVDIKKINNTSFLFFIAQALSLFFLSIDNFLISSLLGAEKTAEYSIIHKIFFTVISVYSILLIHFWNSVTDAFERKNNAWILKATKRLFYTAFIVLIFCFLISFFQEELMFFWLGDEIAFKSSAFYFFTIYTFFHCINAIFVNIQNGIGILKIQIIANTIVILLYILIIKFSVFDDYEQLIKIKTLLMLILVTINALILKKIK
jgi:O-antigen/teichoic acid export membrane protein